MLVDVPARAARRIGLNPLQPHRKRPRVPARLPGFLHADERALENRHQIAVHPDSPFGVTIAKSRFWIECHFCQCFSVRKYNRGNRRLSSFGDYSRALNHQPDRLASQDALNPVEHSYFQG